MIILQFLHADILYNNFSYFLYRLLYKQRYFENIVGSLVDTFDNTAGSTKQNALLAVSSLLPHLPNLVLSAHIERVNFPQNIYVVVCRLRHFKSSVSYNLGHF